jgi:integrase
VGQQASSGASAIAPQYAEPETETLTAAETRALLRLTAHRRNGTRWSVALSLGLRQNEALGLRRRYVDLDKAVIFVHWQITHERYRHGCPDPRACGAQKHIPVPARLREAQNEYPVERPPA